MTILTTIDRLKRIQDSFRCQGDEIMHLSWPDLLEIVDGLLGVWIGDWFLSEMLESMEQELYLENEEDES